MRFLFPANLVGTLSIRSRKHMVIDFLNSYLQTAINGPVTATLGTEQKTKLNILFIQVYKQFEAISVTKCINKL